MNRTYNIAEFHQRLLLMMNEIHGICIEHGIKYTMIGGTLIGALRHKGFIPWDDDMDIAMTWDNYKRFLAIVSSMQHEWLEFATAGVSDGFYQPFIKAYDNRTTFMEEHQDNPMGIFIDIFPIVPAGNTRTEALKAYNRYRFYQSLLKRKGYHFSTGLLRERILTFVARFCTVSFLVRCITAHYEKLSQNDFKFSSDMDGNTKGIVPSELFSNYSLYDFCDTKLMGISDADRYLRLIFGDYMQLPPKEQQVPHHIIYMDLNTPYRKFKYNQHNDG